MFCYHCQEAKKNLVCDKTGICGKNQKVATLQDLLMFTLEGLAIYAVKAKQAGIVDGSTNIFMAKALFSTVTNVNFDPAIFIELIKESVQRRNRFQQQGVTFDDALPESATWQYQQATAEEFNEKGLMVGVMADPDMNEDERALRETLIYGLKGLAAFIEQARVLGKTNTDHYTFLNQAMAFTGETHPIESYIPLLMQCGKQGFQAMALMEQANIAHFGTPEPSKVYLDADTRPAILITGNDLLDLEDLLEQTAGTGVDVYTHGDMLSAHTYPAFKKYFNLYANYGGAWWEQRMQFDKFHGPILVTSTDLQQPKKQYQQRLFTTGMAGWDGIPHIANRKAGQRKDFSAIIDAAKQCEAPVAKGEGYLVSGFSQQSLFEQLEQIAMAVKVGAIKRIVVMAGYDGRHKERKYYTEFVQSLSKETLILTAGSAKFRYQELNLEENGELPRLLDVGQSSDFCSVITFIKQLADTLGEKDINQLPISFNLAWYEQKTIVMLLSLWAMNIKNIRLGPTLPAFFTPNILKLWDEKFALKGIGKPAEDVAAMMAGE